MTILPLIERELRVRARSPAGYWTRFGAALGGILVCLPALTMFPGMGSSQAEMGAFAFHGLVMAAFILCCCSGFLTVDGMSRERREGTLGLLFLTRVRVLDVLLGKFGAAGLAGLCALAACVPVLIVPILTGGVSGGEAARTVLALFDTMILSLAAGLWASARGRGWWTGARAAALLLLAVVLGPLLLRGLLPQFSPLNVSWPGPLGALEAAGDINYRRAAGAYWISIGVIHAISWLLVIAAGVRLWRALREDNEALAQRARRTSGGNAGPGFMLANYEIRFHRSKPLAEGEAPLAWLMRRQRGIRMLVWAGALLGVAYSGLLLFVRFTGGMSGGYSRWGINMAFATVESCLFAWAASRFFIESRREGELELLLTTPEGAKNIVASQWKWLRSVFRWPTVALVAPPLVMLLPSLLFSDQQWAGFALYSISSQLISCVSTIAGMVALVWVGMWCGWSERSQARAIVRIVILAKGAPYVIGMLGSLVIRGIGLNYMYANPQFNATLILIWNIPQILNLLYYFYLYRWARRRLAAQVGHTSPKSGLDSLLKSMYQPG